MRHQQRETDRLKRKILALGAIVEENLRIAFQAIDERDAAKARRVIATDVLIDQNEVDVEEECLKILALYQPVAGDLRFVAAVIKINSELERIGDLSANIAERALQLMNEHPVAVPQHVAVMADRTRTIIEKALDALVRQDAVMAREVLAADDEIDELYAELIDELKGVIRADLEHLDAIVLLFSVARYLERLADHATNIAEDVLYMVEGEIQRHHQATVAAGNRRGAVAARRSPVRRRDASDAGLTRHQTCLPGAGPVPAGGRHKAARAYPYQARAAARTGLVDLDGRGRRLRLAAREVVLGGLRGAHGVAVGGVAGGVAAGERLGGARGRDAPASASGRRSSSAA